MQQFRILVTCKGLFPEEPVIQVKKNSFRGHFAFRGSLSGQNIYQLPENSKGMKEQPHDIETQVYA